MFFQGYLLDFAVLFEGYFLFVSFLLLEWRWLGIDLEVVDILISWGYTPLNISRELLIPADCYGSSGCRYFHAQIELVDNSFELIDCPSTEDCTV